ncbi:MAG: hypothetical protein PF450_02025 [Bacteroidales bacterium]|jgi:hypothetical protein|nr:hypothetical protein [Bacteroidales bacterium]
MNQLHLLYKQETGKSIQDFDIGVVRSHREWILDPQEVDDELVIQKLFGYSGRIRVPDTEYIKWLEEK